MQADAAQRAQRAWSARVAGNTWAGVAELVGFADASTACRAVRTYFGTLPQHDREETRSLWRERHEVVWRQTIKDMAKDKPGATRAAVAVARSAALLDGLDQPHRIELTNPSNDELSMFVQRLAIAAGAELIVEADPFNTVDAEVIEDTDATAGDLPA